MRSGRGVLLPDTPRCTSYIQTEVVWTLSGCLRVTRLCFVCGSFKVRHGVFYPAALQANIRPGRFLRATHPGQRRHGVMDLTFALMSALTVMR